MVTRQFYRDYNIDALTFKYGVLGPRNQGFGGIKTAGSSTTISRVTADSGVPHGHPFSPLAAGDILWLPAGGVLPYVDRRVASVTLPGSITVDSAIDLTAGGIGNWYFQKFLVGVTATDGWLFVGDLTEKLLTCRYVTNPPSGTVNFQVQGVIAGEPDMYARPHEVVPDTAMSTTLKDNSILIEGPWAFLRVGVRASADAANNEAFSAELTGRLLSEL